MRKSKRAKQSLPPTITKCPDGVAHGALMLQSTVRGGWQTYSGGVHKPSKKKLKWVATEAKRQALDDINGNYEVLHEWDVSKQAAYLRDSYRAVKAKLLRR